jgi:hypothetical protein
MPFAVNVLVSMSHGLVAVLMPVMTVRNRFMCMLMLMLVFVMAAHGSPLLSAFFLKYYKVFRNRMKSRFMEGCYGSIAGMAA